MFGIPSSIKIIDRVNSFYQRDRKNKKKYKVAISPPHTLLESFSKAFKNKNTNLFVVLQNRLNPTVKLLKKQILKKKSLFLKNTKIS